MSNDAQLPQGIRAHPWGRAALTVLLLAAGAGLLIWQVNRLDISAATLRDGFASVGSWFLVVLLLSLVRFALRTHAWMALQSRQVPFRTALAATIAGDTLGNVTPLGPVAGEPTKALYLRPHAEPKAALAALTAENFFYSISVAVYVIVSVGAMLTFFDLPRQVHMAGLIALAAMASVLAGAAWLAWQRPAVASHLFTMVPIARVRRLTDWVRTFEDDAYGRTGPPRSSLATVMWCEAGFHLLSLTECWLIFWLLTGESRLLPALVFDGFNRVANIVFKPVPMRLGVEESGTAMLAAAIGLSATSGFMLSVVRKLRVIVWAGVGMYLLWRRTLSGSSTKYEVRSTK